MLSEKDVGKRVRHEDGRLGILRKGGESGDGWDDLLWIKAVGNVGWLGTWSSFLDGWTLDEPAEAVTPEGLRRFASGPVPAALRAILRGAADEIERLAEEQRKIIDLCGRGGDAGVTAEQAVAQMRERLDAVEESAEAARAEWLDRDLGT